MKAEGLSDGAVGLLALAGMMIACGLLDLFTRRRRRYDLIHRRGGKLFSQEEAGAEARKKGGAA